jgi:hypothetical protein
MIKALLMKRLAAVVFSVAVSSVIPFVLQDKPVLSGAWGRFGPVIVDAAKDRVGDALDGIE